MAAEEQEHVKDVKKLMQKNEFDFPHGRHGISQNVHELEFFSAWYTDQSQTFQRTSGGTLKSSSRLNTTQRRRVPGPF